MLATLTLGLFALGAGPAVAAPQPAGQARADVVDVLKVSGYLDPVLVDYVEGALDAARHDGAVAVVMQLNSPGSLVGDAKLDELVDQIKRSPVPVGVWVGPSGAKASGGAARLVTAADFAAVARGSSVEIAGRHVGESEALDRHITNVKASVLGDFIVNLPGVATTVVQRNGEPRRELADVSSVRFSQLPLASRLMHTVASPAVAYLLFTIGLALILFEFFTAGVGVAGVTGAVAFILGCYGFSVLPTTALGIGLLLLAMFGFAVDVQTGVPRVWTGIATVSFVVGSLVLYDGIMLSWITLLVAIVGMVVAMISGMPAMVRSRFSTPTIGRDWMIGEQGTAVTAVAPDGLVLVRDAPWRARTNRATPIAEGDGVRVASIEGLVLEVEPLEGAARDYREGRKSAPEDPAISAPGGR
jgi:membrane-bound serine protease (ClpP class)